MRQGDLAHDPQPEAEAPEVLRRDRALEAIEDPRLVFGGDAGAVIEDREARRCRQRRDPDLDRAPLAVLAGVGEQVDDELLELQAIPIAPGRRGRVDDDRTPRALELEGGA